MKDYVKMMLLMVMAAALLSACAAGVSGKKYSFRNDNQSYTVVFDKGMRDGSVVLFAGSDNTKPIDIGYYRKLEPRLYEIWFDSDCQFGSLFGTDRCHNYFLKDSDNLLSIDPKAPRLHRLEIEPK
jgi:hypothetical protein